MTSKAPSAESVVRQAADLFEAKYAFPGKGAANATKVYTLTPHVWMAITYGYCIHPITETNFEGVGVEPEKALDEAHRLAVLQVSKNLKRDWPQSVLDAYKDEVSRELERLSSD